MSITNSGTAITFSDSSTQSAAARCVNVAQTALTGIVSISSASFVNITGLSVSITPKSTSSVIFVFVSLEGCTSDNAVSTVYGKQIRVTRNGTVIGVGNARGSSTQSLASWGQTYSANYGFTNTAKWMDSPATTAACSYQVQFLSELARAAVIGGSYNSGGIYNSSTLSTITVMEYL